MPGDVDALAEALAVVSPTMAPALEPSDEACPLCGASTLRLNPDGIGAPWAVACDECCRDWRSIDELMAEVVDRDTLAWRALPDYLRDILREPATERAMRRLVRPVLAAMLDLGGDPDVALAIAEAVNARRARPMPRAHLEDLLVEVAEEIGAERKRARG